MTREEFFCHLDLGGYKFGEGANNLGHWYFNGEIYGHPTELPITIDDWNRAKIKPNTKVRILSEEHSAYVQKLAFENGFVWLDGRKDVNYTEKDYLYLTGDGRVMTHGTSVAMFKNHEHKEIFIEMPEVKTPNINARVLAEKVSASNVLSQGAKHLSDRAATYDSPEGERSMGATVEAFESVTGHALTEEQGWLFMVMLKAVRSQQGNYKLDNYEDGAAYFALMAEAASEARK